MAVHKKIIIGNPNAEDPNNFFAIAKIYGPNEAMVDGLIAKIENLVSKDGFTVEIKGVILDTDRKWSITKVQ